MNRRAQQWCLWSGPVFMAVFLLGFWVIAGLVPPPSPHDSALKIAHVYQQNTNGIRAGLLITMIAAALMVPFGALITVHMRRIEGRSSVLAYTVLAMTAINCILITMPVMIMTVAAFRPGRDPVLTQTLNDLAWIPFVMVFPPAVVQSIAIAFATFTDKAKRPVFPRWVAYFNLWVAFLFLPAGLLTFFKHGPFAWNGLLSFWVALSVFGTWYVVMFVALRGAIKQEFEAEPVAAEAPADLAAPAPVPIPQHA
jgi:hypothetical protein